MSVTKSYSLYGQYTVISNTNRNFYFFLSNLYESNIFQFFICQCCIVLIIETSQDLLIYAKANTLSLLFFFIMFLSTLIYFFLWPWKSACLVLEKNISGIYIIIKWELIYLCCWIFLQNNGVFLCVCKSTFVSFRNVFMFFLNRLYMFLVKFTPWNSNFLLLLKMISSIILIHWFYLCIWTLMISVF